MSTPEVWKRINLDIDQIAQLTGLDRSTLERWEREFSDDEDEGGRPQKLSDSPLRSLFMELFGQIVSRKLHITH